MYHIRDIKDLLRIIGRTQAVLIGGQAINLWSERYQKEGQPPWSQSLPFTSLDIDLLGNQSDAKYCAEGMNAWLELPNASAHTPQLAKIHCSRPELDIDILHTANGLNTAEVMQTAVELKYEDIPIKLLHPVLCIESKTINLITLDQQVEGRQDEKHLRLAIANCREFLAELTVTCPPGDLLAWAQRLCTGATTQVGLDVQRKYSVSFTDSIPTDLWQKTIGPLSDWVQTELPQWRNSVRQKISDIEDVEKWLRSLNPPRPKSS